MSAITNGETVMLNDAGRYVAPNARAAADAEVIPEHITANATRNVTNGTLNARLAYSAAPAALGYFPTSSR
jgi:hypothetical protein